MLISTQKYKWNVVVLIQTWNFAAHFVGQKYAFHHLQLVKSYKTKKNFLAQLLSKMGFFWLKVTKLVLLEVIFGH